MQLNPGKFLLPFATLLLPAVVCPVHANNAQQTTAEKDRLSSQGSPQFAVAQDAVLRASNLEGFDHFGFSVSISGNTAVVGAPQEDSSATGVNGDQSSNETNNAGAVYVFVKSGSNWVQEAYLKQTPSVSGGGFGRAVAISGDTIVVGADRFGNTQQTSGGAAYVFVRTGSTWKYKTPLFPDNYQGFDSFGRALAISGDTIVVGAPGEDSAATGVNGDGNDNSMIEAGAAYVFVRDGDFWNQEAYLKASNTETRDDFGRSVAISGNIVVAGATDEDSAAAGVNGDSNDNSMIETGAAYVFERTGNTWIQAAYLKASTPGIFDHFGSSVTVSGETIAVGADSEGSAATGSNGDQNNNDAQGSGAVYIFTRKDTVWSQQSYLKASNTQAGDTFGCSVALFENSLAVGALREDSQSSGVNGNQDNDSERFSQNSGAVYLFARSGNAWCQQAYLKQPFVIKDSKYGSAVAVTETGVLVGAYNDRTNVPPFGSLTVGGAYLYDTSDTPEVYCEAKPSSAGCLTSIFTSDLSVQPTSAANDYQVTATQVQELKNGLLFAGSNGTARLPFQGGTLCIQPPTKRGPTLFSAGSLPTGCNGSFSLTVNDGNIIPSGLDGGPGNSVWYQFWYRDPANGSGGLGTALSNALRLDFQ